jgi:hypothetical protein
MLTNEFGLEIPNMRLQDMESEKITPGEAGEPADPGNVQEDEEDEDEDEDDEKSSDGDDVDDEGDEDEDEDEDEDDEDDPDELKVDSTARQRDLIASCRNVAVASAETLGIGCEICDAERRLIDRLALELQRDDESPATGEVA